MMKVYIDITLLPSDDIGHHFLWEKVYQQVHLALVEIQDANGCSAIGVGFPEFNAGKHRLGRKFRVFAPDRNALDKLNIQHWLERLADYVHMTSIKEVPEAIEIYQSFSRLQVKSNPERIARRVAKYKGISYEEALVECTGVVAKRTAAPFIWMKSQTSDNRFRLFIQQEKVAFTEGLFNTYGLSKGGVLPYLT